MFNRKAALTDIRVLRPTDWATVSKWIREMVARESKVMRQVSKARFGALNSWISRGRSNISPGFCGCLVGTTALALVEDRNHFRPLIDCGSYYDFVRTTGDDAGESACADEVVCELVAHAENNAWDAGVAAMNIGECLGQEQAVALFKSEIREQLRLRSRRIAGGLKRAKSAKRKADGTFKQKVA
jgi:hypothetical protein